MDFYLKKEINNFNIWTSYSFTEAKNMFNDINNNAFFTPNTSIIHAISTSASYKIKQFQVALGWKWHTGKPFTKSIINNDKITFTGINTGRLPNYHRLDFSSTYSFEFNKKHHVHGKLGISIRNIYNQHNHLSKEYYGFNNANDPIKIQDKYSLSFMPNFLFKINW